MTLSFGAVSRPPTHLSDIYAMGGTPMTALQLLAWPRGELDWDIAADVIDGGLAVLVEAGCTLIGGHSIDDPEPKYGFAITGTVHPDRMLTNAAGVPGDALVLTKPIGTGVITTALKAGAAPAGVLDAAAAIMTRLNASAAAAAVAGDVSAATDVTGFGLLGHLRELVDASGVTAVVDPRAVPVIEGARELAEGGSLPERVEAKPPRSPRCRRHRRYGRDDAEAPGGCPDQRWAAARRSPQGGRLPKGAPRILRGRSECYRAARRAGRRSSDRA